MSRLSSLADRYRVDADPLRSERRIELAVAILTVVLLLQLLYSAARLGFLSEPEPIAPSLDLLASGTTPGATRVDPALSEEIRSRPLFWSSRRPLTAEPAAAAEVVEDNSTATAELDKVQLVGIFGAGDSAGIITLVKGKKRRILLGENLEGWTLDDVGPNRAVFKDKGKTHELRLEPPREKGKS